MKVLASAFALASEQQSFILLCGDVRQHLPDPVSYLDSWGVFLSDEPLELLQTVQLHPVPAEPSVFGPLQVRDTAGGEGRGGWGAGREKGGRLVVTGHVSSDLPAGEACCRVLTSSGRGLSSPSLWRPDGVVWPRAAAEASAGSLATGSPCSSDRAATPGQLGETEVLNMPVKHKQGEKLSQAAGAGNAQVLMAPLTLKSIALFSLCHYAFNVAQWVTNLSTCKSPKNKQITNPLSSDVQNICDLGV